MPWCDDCSRYWKAEELEGEGECPTCHAEIGEPAKTPWHLKLLVLAVVLYLGWRAVQGVEWAIHHFT